MDTSRPYPPLPALLHPLPARSTRPNARARHAHSTRLTSPQIKKKGGGRRGDPRSRRQLLPPGIPPGLPGLPAAGSPGAQRSGSPGSQRGLTGSAVQRLNSLNSDGSSSLAGAGDENWRVPPTPGGSKVHSANSTVTRPLRARYAPVTRQLPDRYLTVMRKLPGRYLAVT